MFQTEDNDNVTIPSSNMQKYALYAIFADDNEFLNQNC